MGGQWSWREYLERKEQSISLDSLLKAGTHIQPRTLLGPEYGYSASTIYSPKQAKNKQKNQKTPPFLEGIPIIKIT